MPTTCGFPNCKFRSRYKGFEDNRHFYRVPKKPAVLRDKWLEAIGRTEANIVSQLRICSGHFHGGEKKEGDIPVADPAVDPPRRIDLPSKTLRLQSSGRFNSSGPRRSTTAGGTRRSRGSATFRHIAMNIRPVRRPPASQLPSLSLLPPPPPAPQSPHPLPSRSLMAFASKLTTASVTGDLHRLAMLQTCGVLSKLRSYTVVVFEGRFVGESELQTLKNLQNKTSNVVIIRKLAEFWTTTGILDTPSVLIFYDMQLYDKEVIMRFKDLKLVVLADLFSNCLAEASKYFHRHGILHRMVQPEPDIEVAADIILWKILESDYDKSSCLESSADRSLLKGLRGRIIGIIGLDSIGLALARRCSVLGLKIIVHDPTLPEGTCSSLGFSYSEHFESILPLCNFISFHNWRSIHPIPLSCVSHITCHHLCLIKKDAVIICATNRVSLDTMALTIGLCQGHLKRICLTKEQISELMNTSLDFRGTTEGFSNVREVNLSTAVTEESFSDHRQKVMNSISRLLSTSQVHNELNLQDYIPNMSLSRLRDNPNSTGFYHPSESTETSDKSAVSNSYKQPRRTPFSVDNLVVSPSDT